MTILFITGLTFSCLLLGVGLMVMADRVEALRARVGRMEDDLRTVAASLESARHAIDRVDANRIKDSFQMPDRIRSIEDPKQ